MNPKSTEPEAPDFDELVEIVRLSVRRARGMDERTDHTESRIVKFVKKYTGWVLNNDLSEPLLTKARQIVMSELGI